MDKIMNGTAKINTQVELKTLQVTFGQFPTASVTVGLHPLNHYTKSAPEVVIRVKLTQEVCDAIKKLLGTAAIEVLTGDTSE